MTSERAALEKYGEHTGSCARSRYVPEPWMQSPCSCPGGPFGNGAHEMDCPRAKAFKRGIRAYEHALDERECDCGLDAALAAARGEPEPGAESPKDALDVERLARAIDAAERKGGNYRDPKRHRWLAERVAAEYEEPQPNRLTHHGQHVDCLLCAEFEKSQAAGQP